MSKRFIAALAGALAIAALAAGCGGGSSETATTDATGGEESSGAPALSKTEFIAKADAICAKAKETSNEQVADFIGKNGLDEGSEPSQEQGEELISEVLLPSIKTEAEEIGALGPPKGEEGAVEEIVTGLEDVVAGGLEDPASLVDSDDPFADVNEKAKAFGLKTCSET